MLAVTCYNYKELYPEAEMSFPALFNSSISAYTLPKEFLQLKDPYRLVRVTTPLAIKKLMEMKLEKNKHLNNFKQFAHRWQYLLKTSEELLLREK